MNAVLSSSFSHRGIGIRHTLILCDKGIAQLDEGTVGLNRFTTTTASNSNDIFISYFTSCKSNYHCDYIKLIYEKKFKSKSNSII